MWPGESTIPGYTFDQAPESFATAFREQAEAILRAAYPELHGDSPTHWLAPNEAESAMCIAWEEAYVLAPPGSGTALAWEAAYSAMRSAYLNTQEQE